MYNAEGAMHAFNHRDRGLVVWSFAAAAFDFSDHRPGNRKGRVRDS